MTAGLPIRPAPAAFRISTASPILLHPSLFTVFRVVPTLVSHENDSQMTRVSSLAGMEVEPSTWYSSRVTLPSHDLAHWRLTSQPCLCSNHHSTWAQYIRYKCTQFLLCFVLSQLYRQGLDRKIPAVCQRRNPERHFVKCLQRASWIFVN